MADLNRGGNVPLASPTLDISVAGAQQGSVDLMVFQLGPDHKVRSDADFVFFNQPVSPEGAVRLTAVDRLSIDLGQVPAAVDSLSVTVAVSDEVPGSLAGIPGLGVSVRGSADEHSAPAVGLTTERAAVLIEIYRRGPEWKLRNVSAGWTAGLAELVTQHGVSVAEDTDKAGADRHSVSTAAQAPAPTPTPPAPLPAPAASAEWPDGQPVLPKGTVDLGKRSGAISLSKGQRVSIQKTNLIVASITWPPQTDYDVFALVRYRDGHVESVAQFGTSESAEFQQRTRDGAVVHTGDVQRGTASKAEERIEIRMNSDILVVVPVVYSAQSNGLGSFHKYKVSMAIDNGEGTSIQVDAADGNKSRFVFSCVPGIIVNAAQGVEVQSLELYSKRMSEKRPVINEDLTVKMDAGPLNVYKR